MKILDASNQQVGLLRKSDRAFIPLADGNKDYVEYLVWAETNNPLEYDQALITAESWE